MNMRFYLPLLLMALLGRQTLFSQSVGFTKYNFPNHKKELSDALDNIRAGDKYYLEGPGVYRLAIDEYNKAYAFNPSNALLNYKLGRCHLEANDKTDAIKYFRKAIELDERISLEMEYNDVHLLLATALHKDYQFDEAIEHYKKHKNNLTPEYLANEAELIDKFIEECFTAKMMVSAPERVFVDNLGDMVNSAYPDYRPLVQPEESMIIFTSSRENTTGLKRAEDSYYYEDIYATYYEEENWSIPQNSYDLNSANHDATAGISSDGSILYIYKSAGGNNLYESHLFDNIYGYPEKMDNNINNGLKQSSASLTFDKTTLYFTSIREDGYGGQDIYVVKKDRKDQWMEPMNIGATINTPYDEEGVFISPDGKSIYFSSKGHNSMGGFDIFRSDYMNGKWSNPVNLGHPINTPEDDVFFTLSANGQRGYYSSKKKDGYGSHDLYMITFLEASKPLRIHEEEILFAYNSREISPVLAPSIEQNTVLEGLVLDETSLQPIQATIEITDNSKSELLASFESAGATGSYLITLKPGINYGITVSSPEYMFHSENFNIPSDAEARRVKKDILMKKMEIGAKIVLNNIFFDFNKATLRPESVAELDRVTKLMNDTPSLKIEISGHTDNVGSAGYNQKLSGERAKAVVDYLVRQNISASRLEYEGYGMDQPIADNKTDDGRQKNRRTEFKILEK
jgi:outer membrane protein OmpA-like peptidoglycan-associated protein/tetratricopeptide (TPR) repeat protein